MIRNGVRYSQQRYLCKGCGRSFVLSPKRFAGKKNVFDKFVKYIEQNPLADYKKCISRFDISKNSYYRWKKLVSPGSKKERKFEKYLSSTDIVSPYLKGLLSKK